MQDAQAYSLHMQTPAQLRFMKDSFCFLTGSVGSGTSLADLVPVGSLYSFSKDWKPTKHLTNITVSNGLAWSKDKMYYIDTMTRKVDSFDFDAESGKICKYPYFSCIINFTIQNFSLFH
jgi:sugar lactone lactonase YvrE